MPEFPSEHGYRADSTEQAQKRQQAQSVPLAPRQSPSFEGCVGAAWRDISGSEGWLKRILLLCLINCVPVLNFGVQGYSVRWASELSFGKRAPLPKAVFEKGTMAVGFFAMLVRLGLVFALGIAGFAAWMLVSSLVGMVSPIAAGVVGIVLLVALWVFEMFFFNPAVDASVIRMSVVGSLDSGFELKRVWAAFMTSKGGLIAASIVPRLIVGLIVGALITLVMLVGGSVAGIGLNTVAGGNMAHLQDYMAHNPQVAVQVTSRLGGGFMLLSILVSLITVAFATFATLFTDRAVGHWVARTAPEWANEATGSAKGWDSAAPQPEASVFGSQVDPIVSETARPSGTGVAFVSGAGVATPSGFAGAASYAASVAPNGGVALAGGVSPVVPTTAPAAPISTTFNISAESADFMPASGASPIDIDNEPHTKIMPPSVEDRTTKLAGGDAKLVLVRIRDGKQFGIAAFPATVGKGSGASIRVEGNSSISRMHVQIISSGSTYAVEELGATNRTALNGRELATHEMAELHDGDELILAEEAFAVKIG